LHTAVVFSAAVWCRPQSAAAARLAGSRRSRHSPTPTQPGHTNHKPQLGSHKAAAGRGEDDCGEKLIEEFWGRGGKLGVLGKRTYAQEENW